MRFRGDIGSGGRFLLALGFFFNPQILKSRRPIGNVYKRHWVIRVTFRARSIVLPRSQKSLIRWCIGQDSNLQPSDPKLFALLFLRVFLNSQ
jgi:hypothetical protein